jgi:hypothetical protein
MLDLDYVDAIYPHHVSRALVRVSSLVRLEKARMSDEIIDLRPKSRESRPPP